MALNVTTATVTENDINVVALPPLAQWDEGQILMIEGVELPESFRVDFSNKGDSSTIPAVGTPEGVLIPNALLKTGKPIMAYAVLFEGIADKETEYWITINVKARPVPTGVDLSDDQSEVIDNIIRSVNTSATRAANAAGEAEAASQAIQDMNVEAETLPDESPLTVTKEVDPETGAVTLIFGLTRGPKGTKGDDGYSPTITITPIQGGHRFTVTDKDHPTGQSFDVMNGAPGAPGSPGKDGYSPTITITTITGGHRFTVTDEDHPTGQSFDVMNGAKGDAGYSPAVTITTITGGHSVTITDEDHPTGQSFDVLDGASDAGQVSYDPTRTYQSGTVGKELSDQKNAIGQLDDVVNDPVHGLAQKAPLIINTASGDIASFPDGADAMPIKSLVASIEPVQDLHGYEYPWPAGGGKNKLPPPTQNSQTTSGVTFVKNNDGSITLSGTATADAAIVFVSFDLPAGDYILSNVGSNAAVSGGEATVYVRDITNSATLTSFELGDSVSGFLFTLSANINIRFYAVVQSGVTVSGTLYQMIRNSGDGDNTYAPYSNECPISGHTGMTVARTGMNLFGGEALRDAILAVVSNATTGTDENGRYVTVPASALADLKLIFKMPFKANTSYTAIYRYKKNNTNGLTNIAFKYTDGDNGYLSRSGTTVADTVYTEKTTTQSSRTIENIITVWGSGTATIYYDYFGIFEGNVSIDDFEPYTGTTIPITFPETIYGGSDEVIGGALASTLGMVDLGTLNWSMSGNPSKFYANVPAPYYKMSLDAIMMSSIYKFDGIGSSGRGYYGENGTLRFNYNGTNPPPTSSYEIYIHDDNYTDAATFKAAMSGVQLCYELATPVEYTLDGEELTTLYGQNNVWTDVGEVSVDYPADTKLYIDNKITTAIANALNA